MRRLILPLLAVLACNPADLDGLQPRDLDVRPPVSHALPLGAVADILDSCAPEAKDGPIVSLVYTELIPPGDAALAWKLELVSVAVAPAWVADCIRETVLKSGGVELPEPDTTSADESSTG